MVDLGHIRPDNDKEKQPIYRSGKSGFYYAIFRVGKKYKMLDQIKGYQKHMQREMEVPNANRSIQNEILIGSANVYEDVLNYISDCKLRTNSIIARELLLTASPDFFRGIHELDHQRWVELNKQWLIDKFGDNVKYAVLHKDERTWHIHALVVPKFENKLSHCKYFDGPDKLRQWQDEYSSGMNTVFKALNRGIRFSKTPHVEIRHFYGIINNVKARENSEEIFKHNILLNSKLKAIEATLKAYEELLKDKEKSLVEVYKLNLDLSRQVKDIKKDRDIYKGVVKQLSQTYHLPQNAIEKTLKYIQQQDNEMHR